MDISIPDELNRRLEQLAWGTGQDVKALIGETIGRQTFSMIDGNLFSAAHSVL